MTLIEATAALDSLDEGSTLYALEPWTKDSKAIVAPEAESGGIPPEAERLGLTYFLEVFIARQFIEGWVGNLDTEPTPEEKCARLIQYAINDA